MPKAVNIIQSRQHLLEIGSNAKQTFDETKDLKAGLLAVKALGEATRTAVVQVQYKKLVGKPVKIDFLEE